MNRELKFRVWNGESMITPDYVARTGFAAWTENSIPCTSTDIMQFTGLTDKNGTKIFEGDILQGANSIIYTVFFNNGCFFGKVEKYFLEDDGIDAKNRFDSPYSLFHLEMTSIEVIGNIHEHPHLLEAVKS